MEEQSHDQVTNEVLARGSGTGGGMRFEHREEHPSQWAAMGMIVAEITCTAETLRSYVRQAER